MRAEYDPEQKIGYHFYEGLVDYEKLIGGCEKVLEYYTDREVKALFSNLMLIKGTFSKANSFFNEKVIPYFDKKNVVGNYHAMNTDVFTRFAMNQLFKMSKAKLDLMIFKNPEEVKNFMEKKLSITLNVPPLYMKK